MPTQQSNITNKHQLEESGTNSSQMGKDTERYPTASSHQRQPGKSTETKGDPTENNSVKEEDEEKVFSDEEHKVSPNGLWKNLIGDLHKFRTKF